jgi:transmembrane sensor
MNSSEQRLKILFIRWYDQQLGEDDQPELLALLKQADNEGRLEPIMREAYETLQPGSFFTEHEIAQMAAVILKDRRGIVRKISWKKIAIAASILLLLGLGSYFVFINKKDNPPEIVLAPTPTDIKAPEINRAMITLANGKKVYLDSANSGTLIAQAGVEIVKLADGKIEYKGTAQTKIYNTLSNPRGSKVIDMTLADGSRVWLNAGSSVTYPIAFVGNERKVSITGEAYFEVAPDKSKPFYVSKGDMQVQVLGTHFNVNAYEDETDIKVTLIEGSVRVNNTIIKPGQQAQVSNDVKVVGHIDLDEIMAWKNGVFKFTRTDLKVIMREIGRWYDVKVIYEGNIQVQLYNVGIPRTANVSEVLRGLEYTGANFSVEGKKIIVRP